MSSFNPMFDEWKGKNKNSFNQSNVRVTATADKQVSAPRRTRSDKLVDIKIPLTYDHRILIRERAKKNEMFPTNYCSYLVKKGLIRNIPFPEPDISYPSSSPLSFHVRLEQDKIRLLDEWAIRWDCSRKKAAYRILVGLLTSEGGTRYEQQS